MENDKPKATIFIPEDKSYGEVRVRFPYVSQAQAFQRMAYAIINDASNLGVRKRAFRH